MSGFPKLEQQMKEACDPVEVLIADLNRAAKAHDSVAAKKIMRSIGQVMNPCPPLKRVNAYNWIGMAQPEPDQIIENIIDTGDKMAIIGSSKARKSFFLLQLALSIASGRPFLEWEIPKPRCVVYVQLEIKEEHFQRRLKNLCRASGIDRLDIKNRLDIINGRGFDLSGREGIDRIMNSLNGMQPEVIVIDPLYKISAGAENSAEDMKATLSFFDQLSAETGAAIIYVHHDSKGTSGDRDIRDRGAGSNVLSRDYDACISLSAHSQNEDATVVDILLRNYAPQKPFSVLWSDDGRGYCFRVAHDIAPNKKTSRTKAPQFEPFTYLAYAEAILKNGEMALSDFRDMFKKNSGLSEHRCRDFISWAKKESSQHFDFREERGRGVHRKWIKLKERINTRRKKIEL